MGKLYAEGKQELSHACSEQWWMAPDPGAVRDASASSFCWR